MAVQGDRISSLWQRLDVSGAACLQGRLMYGLCALSFPILVLHESACCVLRVILGGSSPQDYQ